MPVNTQKIPLPHACYTEAIQKVHRKYTEATQKVHRNGSNTKDSISAIKHRKRRAFQRYKNFTRA